MEREQADRSEAAAPAEARRSIRTELQVEGRTRDLAIARLNIAKSRGRRTCPSGASRRLMFPGRADALCPPDSGRFVPETDICP
jgi:hypothetical protein